MVVQHNLTAMNSNRMLGLTQATLSKSTEKLSSGYKVNRAADDAAGLSISEKMRKQIRGLTQASANAEDGISAVQTAEGALTEVHDMLQRMNELAVKSANETNSTTDRNYIQAEVDQLVTEIDRVATTTKFNEIYLLKGKNADGASAKLTYSTAASTVGKLAGWSADKGIATIIAATDFTGVAADTVATGKAFTIDGKTYGVVESLLDDTYTTLQAAADDLTAGDVYVYASMDDMVTALKHDEDLSTDIKNIEVTTDGTDVALRINAFADLNNGLEVSLHVGADSTADNKIKMNLNMMSARGLGINGLEVNGDNDDKATEAIDTIATAIQKVSTQRSSLGAIQNRLEHTTNNLDNIVENTTAAESQIRDTDMATEMVKYSNSNILAQAGQAMLAQSNQANQGILSLLG